MAVYDRAYKPYRGTLTPERSRFLVLPRYALKSVFGSRLFTAFFVLCFVWPLVCGILIYLKHNTEALAILEIEQFLSIDASFFYNFIVSPLAWLAFAVVFIVGPALVSPDLRNNALALYLARPFTRGEYVAGKLTVLLALTSAVTWVPALVLFFLQSYLEGWDWLAEHAWLAPAIVVADLIWILMLSLFALALSAWVKWKMLARVLFLGVYFVLFGLTNVVNALYKTEWGGVLHLGSLRATVWEALFRRPDPEGLPLAAAVVAIALFVGFCLLLLARRVRAYEVAS